MTMFEFKGSLRHHGSYMHHLVLSINFLIRFVSLTSLVPFLLFIHLSGHLFQPHYFYYYSYHPIVPHLLWGELILHLFNKSFQAIIDVWYPTDCIGLDRTYHAQWFIFSSFLSPSRVCDDIVISGVPIRLSVCLSVCPSHASIESKLITVGSRAVLTYTGPTFVP